jgi:hypothetical protein
MKPDLIAALGVALVLFGVGRIYTPIAFIVAGVICIRVAITLNKRKVNGPAN